MSFVSNSPLQSLSDFGSLTEKNTTANHPNTSKLGEPKTTDQRTEVSKDTSSSNKYTYMPKSEFTMPDRPNYYKSVSKTVDVRHLMRKFGMHAGFHLPFSSGENKILLEKLEAQQIKVLKLKGDIEESQSAIKELKGHAIQSAIDIRFTQSLVDTKTMQRDRDTDNVIIENRAHEKRTRLLVRLKADLMDYNERNRIRLIDLEKRKDKMKMLQEKVMSDKKRLEIWKLVSSKTESFLKLITGHKEHDDRHAWELENKQTDLGALNKELRIELDAAAMNTTKLTEQYARLSIEYRKEHKERKEMVTMWSMTLEAMKKKDMDVKDISKEYCEIHGRIRHIAIKIKEQEKVVGEQEWSIRKIEFDQNIFDRKVGELREKIMKEKDLLILLKNETIMSKVVIQQTTIATQGMEANFIRLESRVKHFIKRAKMLQDIIQILKHRCSDVSKGKSIVENYLGKMEEELKQEEKLYQKNNREVEKMRKFNWERNNDKTSIEEQILRTETRQIRIKSNISVLQAKEYDAMEALAKKQSQIYRLDLEISSTETRMTRIMNDSVNPEYFKLQTQLNILREVKQEAFLEREFISKEVHIVSDCSYRCSKDIEISSKKQKHLKFMVDNINLEANRMQGLLDSFKNEKTLLTIQLSLEKVNLKRLENAYKINRGKILSISQRRSTMEWAVLERKSEINFSVTMLAKQRKELRGHTAKRKLAISNIIIFCEKLKGRFELTTRLMAPSDGFVSGEAAMTFQIHKIARERETLSSEQKKWETRLTEASREAEGLTNVVLIMKNSNDSFRKSLAVASNTSIEAREVDKAMKNQKKSIVIRNRCNKACFALRITIDNLQKQIDVTMQEAEDLVQIVDQKDREASSKTIEHNRLVDRIHRWNNLLNNKTQQLKGKVTSQFLKTASYDLKNQIIALKLQKSLEQLDIAITEQPYISDIVFPFLEEHNMIEDFENARTNRMVTSIRPRSTFISLNPSTINTSTVTTSRPRQQISGWNKTSRPVTSASTDEMAISGISLGLSTVPKRKTSQGDIKSAKSKLLKFL